MSETKKYGIASYGRPKCATIDTLTRSGVTAENIYVSLQKEDQLREYKAIHPNVNYICRDADCAAGNRNTLIDAVGAPLILLDDDITSFAVKENDSNFKRVNDFSVFERAIDKAIDQAVLNRCSVVGIAATTNDLVARGRDEYSYDVLLQGSFLVLLADNLKFDEKWKMVEDYELSLRAILCGHTLRANYISAYKPKNGTNSGGLHERYVNGELPLWIERLSKVYPMFVPNKSKLGGRVRFG